MAVGSCLLMRQICLGTIARAIAGLRFHDSGSIRCKEHFTPVKRRGFSFT
jgi:hypothetical protein